MTLEGPLEAALSRLAETDVLLVALDFDGNISPHVDDPSGARPLPEAARAIEQLAALEGTSVALVSGRAIASLVEVSGVGDDVLLSGSHGGEYRMEPGAPPLALSAEELDVVDRLGAVLHDVARQHPGTEVESKPAGHALHLRNADADTALDAQHVVRRRVLAELPGITARPGKDVEEFSVLAATKGDAIVRLRDHVKASAVFYSGDDLTDEDAFRVLGDGDVGVKVGAGDTLAPFRVPSPTEVADVLVRLVELRSAVVRSR
ncbi:trehalose-phosphatase [Labedella populi]|uniref:Trehalose 6-phosphate phosphatase n=1 Tax=Labedella populi TaxID=2498850 RepID=A0A444QAK2_9MICO|nr:trehalose-phosphatase [Labedella populi]RWZ61096.1 trehalose-phosphatase [Labedella populi]